MLPHFKNHELRDKEGRLLFQNGEARVKKVVLHLKKRPPLFHLALVQFENEEARGENGTPHFKKGVVLFEKAPLLFHLAPHNSLLARLRFLNGALYFKKGQPYFPLTPSMFATQEEKKGKVQPVIVQGADVSTEGELSCAQKKRC